MGYIEEAPRFKLGTHKYLFTMDVLTNFTHFSRNLGSKRKEILILDEFSYVHYHEKCTLGFVLVCPDKAC